ncbi:MAG: hypothetical protein U1E93_12765 [Alphaproteobacteria bacterium]
MAALKKKLTRARPPFDTDLFRQRIEAAYERMWQASQAGQKPAGSAV